MITSEERIRALITNLSEWPFDVMPTFKIYGEDAQLIVEALKRLRENEESMK